MEPGNKENPLKEITRRCPSLGFVAVFKVSVTVEPYFGLILDNYSFMEV